MPQKWITKKGKDGKNRHIPINEGSKVREREVKIPYKQENKKEILAIVDKLLGKSQFFYDWESYNNYDKIIITIPILDGKASDLYQKLKELNIDFKMKLNNPVFIENEEVISYFKSINKHTSKRTLYLNNAWKLWNIIKDKGVFTVNDENEHLLKYIESWDNMKLEINFKK